MSRLVFTCIKNEAPFLLEWLAWYMHLGFDAFLIFSNDCADGSDAMLDRLAELGLVTHVRNTDFENKGPQWTALNSQALAKALSDADLALHVDIDEFLNPAAGSLDALLDQAGNFDALSIPWRFFGNSDISDFKDRPVTAQFTKCSPYPVEFPRQALMCKTLFRPGDWMAKPGVHAPKPKADAAPVWLNGNGKAANPNIARQPLLFGKDAGNQLAQINHYALRSRMSFLVKAARGLPNKRDVAIDLQYWVHRNFNGETDLRLATTWKDCSPIFDRLKADPKLAELHAVGCDWHKGEAARHLATPKGAELYAATVVAGDSRPAPAGEVSVIYQAMKAAYKPGDGSA